MNAWEYLDTPRHGCEDVRALANWSTNYDVRTGTPYQVFLDLIGYSESNYGERIVDNPTRVLGYLELDYLADALKEYAIRPRDVEAWIDGLMEAEMGEEE